MIDGSDYFISSIRLTYNEIHSVILGLGVGFALSLAYSISETLSILSLFFVILSVSLAPHIYSKNYKSTRTVIKEPWYFILSVILIYTVILLTFDIQI